MKIWHKVALILIVTSTIVSLTTLVLVQERFKRNFLHYLNQKEQNRFQPLRIRLREHYQQYGSWAYLHNNRRLWRDILRETHRKMAQEPSHDERPRHPRETRDPSTDRPPPHNPQFAPPPKPMDSFSRLSRRGLLLLDAQQRYVVGFHQHPTNSPYKQAILLNDQVIGYLQMESISYLSNQLDISFSQQQHRHVLVIAGLSVVLALCVAWLVSIYLRRRIHPLTHHASYLTQGNYAHRSLSKSRDELGKLAQDLNELAATLEQNRHARRQWIADISHELRTPLTILQGELIALEDGIRPLDQTAVQSLRAEIEHLNKLVEDLFQLALSDLGALTYQKTRLDPLALFNDVCEVMLPRLSAQHLHIDWQCDTTQRHIHQPLFVMADEKRLRQLFLNLLENSLRYTDQGGRIRIRCETRASPQKYLHIYLEDSAPAVPNEKLTQLFERLYREERSRNRAKGGAGLGLAIAKSIMQAHQGTIRAYASPIGGLGIHLSFPLSN
ncbi:MAG: ATP-binding protein [bacterium]